MKMADGSFPSHSDHPRPSLESVSTVLLKSRKTIPLLFPNLKESLSHQKKKLGGILTGLPWLWFISSFFSSACKTFPSWCIPSLCFPYYFFFWEVKLSSLTFSHYLYFPHNLRINSMFPISGSSLIPEGFKRLLETVMRVSDSLQVP